MDSTDLQATFLPYALEAVKVDVPKRQEHEAMLHRYLDEPLPLARYGKVHMHVYTNPRKRIRAPDTSPDCNTHAIIRCYTVVLEGTSKGQD